MSLLRFMFIVTIQYLMLETATVIPKIRVRRIKHFNPSGFILTWDPVQTNNQTDPIIGYKIIIWKTPCSLETTYRYEGDQLIRIVKSEHVTYFRDDVPQVLPEQVFIVKSNETSATVPHIDLYNWYHIRMLAFTKDAEGPYADAMQFKVGTEEDEKSCEKIISETPVFFNTTEYEGTTENESTTEYESTTE